MNTALFKDVEDWKLIFPCGFHAEILTVIFVEPIRKTIDF